MIKNIASASHHLFSWGQSTYIMGIINLSPDSFSGDGLLVTEDAVTRAKRMVADGANIIDIGGASTRPGALYVAAEDEIKRVVPLITRLSQELKVPLSIDTYKYEVAQAAIAAGVDLINDVWGLKKDGRIASLAAKHQLPIIVTANQRGEESTNDIMAEIISDLKRAILCGTDAGVSLENIIVDPGIGFGKTTAQNLEIIRRLGELKVLGCPILLGPSRKSFIGLTLGLPETECLEGTAAAVAIGIAHGADIVRVHDVKAMTRVARLSDAVVRGQ